MAEARRIQEIAGIRGWDVSCTGDYDDDGLDVSSLRVWLDTDTHGRWALNRTTQAVKTILCEQYGAQIPWFKR